MKTAKSPSSRKLHPNWINIIVLVITPCLALSGAALYIWHSGFSWTDLIPFFAMYFLTGLAITGGYHRYFAHRTYDCNKLVELFYALFGAAALQNSVLYWASDHRRHHRHVDGEQDPYNINRGFLWAHIGWIFFDEPAEYRNFDNIPDLKKNSLLQWQNKYYVPISIVIGLGVPFLMGLCFGRPWGGALWGGVVRLVFVHHCTFLINSAAHYFGTQPYSDQTSAKDSWWLAFFSYGEGYHNYHHTFPGDYRNGIAWFHWDPTKWLIQGLRLVGMSSNLRKISPETIFSMKQRHSDKSSAIKRPSLHQMGAGDIAKPPEFTPSLKTSAS